MVPGGVGRDDGSMSTTPPETGIRPPDHGATFLARSDEGRMLTGVCAGLGRYAGIDPVLVRVGFAVLVLGSGIGFFLYIAAYLLMRDTDGRPGYVEQWTNRVFDSQTVLALLTAMLGFGLLMNLFADSTGPGTIVVGTMIAIALLAARSRGVDLVGIARSLPERLSRRRGREAFGAYGGPYQGGMGAAAYGAGAGVGAEPPAAGYAEPVTAPAAEPRDEPAAAAAEPSAAPSGQGDAPDAGGPGSGVPRSDDRLSERPERLDPTVVLPNVPPTGPSGEPPAAGSGGEGGYRKLKDLAWQAGSSAYAGQEPFAPRGPYSPRAARYAQEDPYGYGGYGYPPASPGVYAGAPTATAPPRRGRSYVGLVTILVAILVGGIMVATQPPGSAAHVPLAGGAVLITIGAGLLVAAWFGRGAGLIAAGTVVSLALIAGGTLVGMPKRIGSYTWTPATTSEAMSERYEVGIGDITLDLTDTKAAPGSRTSLDLALAVGSMEVIVPPAARVEVDATVQVGDITVGSSMRSGPGLKVRTVLEPETATASPPVYVLHIKGGLGDVEVRRG